VNACADCGCDETRGCYAEKHGRPWVCRLIEISVPTDLPPTICSFCLEARGAIDLRGGTIRESLVMLTLELHGRRGLEEMAAQFDNPPEVTRAMAALDHRCETCASRGGKT